MAPSTSTTEALNASEVFRNEFDGYQKMTTSDYLEHSLLFGKLEQYLGNLNRPLNVLDLGCGDAINLAQVISRLSATVTGYTGVDMSETALRSAQKAIQAAVQPHVPVTFYCSDMLSYLKQVMASFDVVLASFALHHLSSEDKKETMREIRRLLKPDDGVFIMVDPFRRVGEDLTAYRQRASEVGETWVNMGKERQTTFIKHMQDYDIVEEEAFFEDALHEAGFSCKDVICRGKIGLQSNVVVFKQ